MGPSAALKARRQSWVSKQQSGSGSADDVERRRALSPLATAPAHGPASNNTFAPPVLTRRQSRRNSREVGQWQPAAAATAERSTRPAVATHTQL